MTRRIVFLLCAVLTCSLAALGCTKNAAPAHQGHRIIPAGAVVTIAPPAPLPENESPPQLGDQLRKDAESAVPELSLEAPKGWLSIPRDRLPSHVVAAYRHQGFDAIIAVKVEMSSQSAAADVAAIATQVKKTEHIDTGKIQVSKDGKTASMTVAGKVRQGFVTVRHLGPDGHVSVTFEAAWPKKNAKACKAAYDRVVKTAKLP